MTQAETSLLKQQFLQGSGGFEPESINQITVHIDYAISSQFDPEDARRALVAWMTAGEPPLNLPERGL